MDNNKEYVLAMYDIRSKQDFIYRSTSVKEIIGGSLIIRDCFKDYLYPSAKEISSNGIYGGSEKEDADFNRDEFSKHLDAGYLGEVVYEGGGNLYILYKDEQAYRDTNCLFSKKVLENVGTLQVLSSYITGIDFDDYKSDRKRLYDKHQNQFL